MAEKIYADILEKIGRTPLVRISKLNRGNAEVLVKVESFNPAGSVKDRIAIGMIRGGGKGGKDCAGSADHRTDQREYRYRPRSRGGGQRLPADPHHAGHHEHRAAQTARRLRRGTRADRRSLGMKGAIAKAEELAQTHPGSFIPQQFDNPANPEYHKHTTAEEIWQDAGGRVDAFVAGVGTGGTLTGVGEVLKARNPDVKLIAVEPSDSPVLSGGRPDRTKFRASAPDSYRPCSTQRSSTKSSP